VLFKTVFFPYLSRDVPFQTVETTPIPIILSSSSRTGRYTNQLRASIASRVFVLTVQKIIITSLRISRAQKMGHGRQQEDAAKKVDAFNLKSALFS